MGKFQEGEGGRPKGSSNKVNSDLRAWLGGFLESNKDRLQSDWDRLKPKDRIILFEKLLKYALPALQSVKFESEFDRLSDEQLQKIIDSFKDQE